MSKRKDLNIFNVSFLDLLSGALGAILILFVIVPKLDSKIRQQLQELETFKELKLEVKEIKGIMTDLEGSVPKEQLSSLQSKFSSITTQVDILEEEIKQLQIQLGKCDDEKSKLNARIQSLNKEIESLKAQVGDTNKMTETLQKENETLRKESSLSAEEIAKLKNEIQRLEGLRGTLIVDKKELEDEIDAKTKAVRTAEQGREEVLAEMEKLKKELEEAQKEAAKVAQLEKEIEEKTEMVRKAERRVQEMAKQDGSASESLQKEIDALKQENKDLEKELAEAKAALKKSQGQGKAKEDRTGVKFKDKNILFVVDVSGSMDDAPEPEKLDQVKAGLKMLVATMNDSYKIDVLVFPKNNKEDYDVLFGQMRTVTDQTKYLVYNYVSKLYARNCTPTRSVMDYVFGEPAYNGAGTITFLSDGLPTARSGTDCPNEDYTDVINHITKLNGGRKTINTLGVGSVYRNNVASDPKVIFMRKLASKNDGFFIGF